MAEKPIKKVRKPKKQKVKQGHKLVWLTLLIILIPVAIVGYVLFTSAQGNDKPVEGSRFSSTDLSPKIDQNVLTTIQNDLLSIDGVESATINLKSATLRAHLNMQDGLDTDTIANVAEQAYSIINAYLPIDTYFTDTGDSKNYDLEIDAYNYMVDDSHPLEGQVYIKITKNGAGNKVVDNMNSPKNADLAASVKAHDTSSDFNTDETTDEDSDAETVEEEGTWYYDEATGQYYYQ